MRRMLLALGRVLHKSFLILSLMIFLLSSIFIFVQPPSYAVQGINEMVKPEEKIQPRAFEKAKESVNSPYKKEKAYEAAKKSPLDVEAEEVKKGVVEEGKVMRDLLTGRKPDGTSVFDSDGK